MVTEAPASQRAYESTKDRILSGELPGGSLLSEVEIAEELAVSRTPVHEAFLRLESEDLLRLIPRRGAVVVPVPPGEATDILEVRVALETAAVRRLASTQADLADLLATLAEHTREQSRLAKDEDLAGFAACDASFHRAIVTASGNALADRFYATLGDRQRRMTIGAIVSRPQRVSTLIREHRALARHIADRDVEAFGAALAHHFSATHNLLLGL